MKLSFASVFLLVGFASITRSTPLPENDLQNGGIVPIQQVPSTLQAQSSESQIPQSRQQRMPGCVETLGCGPTGCHKIQSCRGRGTDGERVGNRKFGDRDDRRDTRGHGGIDDRRDRDDIDDRGGRGDRNDRRGTRGHAGSGDYDERRRDRDDRDDRGGRGDRDDLGSYGDRDDRRGRGGSGDNDDRRDRDDIDDRGARGDRDERDFRGDRKSAGDRGGDEGCGGPISCRVRDFIRRISGR